MRIGIALGGGGIRGAAHLGVLQALEEVGIRADYYAGTSAGSIVATMKALGYSNEECLERMKEINRSFIDVSYFDILIGLLTKFKGMDSVLKGQVLRDFLKRNMEGHTLMDVKRDLAVVSTDINTGAQVIFSSVKIPKERLERLDDNIVLHNRECPTPLHDITYASSAIPGVFRPLKHDGMKLVDGCITNNLPVNILSEMGAEKIIAIDLEKRNPKPTEVKGIFNILGQSYSTLQNQGVNLAMYELQDEIILLNPDITEISALDFDKAKECYDLGYAYGKKIALYVKKEIESQ